MAHISDLHPKPQHAALIAGHPGHIYQVLGWIEALKPKVYVLTDGSGRSGLPEVVSIDNALRDVGGRQGSLFMRFTDLQIYEAILRQDMGLFFGLVKEMTGELLRDKVDFVFGDAAEGYNPTHDLCRMVIGASLESVKRRAGRSIQNYDFDLSNGPTHCPEDLKAKALRLVLTDDELKHCIMAFKRDYSTVANKTDLSNPEAFRTQWLRPCGNRAGYDPLPEDPPFYECYGEKRAAAGHYKDVIRYRRHILPISEALWEFVNKETAVNA